MLAAATLVAGCGGMSAADKEKRQDCIWQAQGQARIDTVLDMYRKGQLGSPEDMRRKVGRPAPFLDASGAVIPLDRLSPPQRIEVGKWVIDLAGADESIRAAENSAVASARRAAQKSC